MQIRENISIRFATVLEGQEREKRKKENTLCLSCNGSGYKGRIGIYEYLPITREIQMAIKDKKTDIEIQEIAAEKGMLTLFAYGKELIKKELTTISEVLRICKN